MDRVVAEGAELRPDEVVDSLHLLLVVFLCDVRIELVFEGHFTQFCGELLWHLNRELLGSLLHFDVGLHSALALGGSAGASLTLDLLKRGDREPLVGKSRLCRIATFHIEFCYNY